MNELLNEQTTFLDVDEKDKDGILKFISHKAKLLDITDDEDALCEYNMYFEKFQDAKYEYEDRYGPLTNFGYVPDCYQWEWVDNPWPWDNEFYK